MNQLIKKWYLFKARIKFKLLTRFLKEEDKILDVGTGNGALAFLILNQHSNLIVSDIDNFTYKDFELNPVILKDDTFPFKSKEFDVVLLTTVLHHCQDPIKVLQEAKRVGQKIIILEEVYDNVFQKYLTFFFDSLNNWDFFTNPHNNQTDEEWKRIFSDLDLNIEHSNQFKFLYFFKQAFYVLS